MAAWHRSRRVDFGLRALGSGMCVTAWLAVQRLVSLHDEPQNAGLVLSVGLPDPCDAVAPTHTGDADRSVR